MNDTVKTDPGKLAGIIACVLGGVSIFFLGIIFVPLAAIAAIVGTISSVRHKNTAAIWVNVLAWGLTIIGFFTSPVLWGMFFLLGGIGAGS